MGIYKRNRFIEVASFALYYLLLNHMVETDGQTWLDKHFWRLVAIPNLSGEKQVDIQVKLPDWKTENPESVWTMILSVSQ